MAKPNADIPVIYCDQPVPHGSQRNGESLSAIVRRYFLRIRNRSSDRQKRIKARYLRPFLIVDIGLAIFASLSGSTAAPLSMASFDGFALTCAPEVDPATLRAVAAVESRFDPWAIRDNTAHQVLAPSSEGDAVTLAQSLLIKGHSVDLGLMQINSTNLAHLHLNVADAFDPCRSLASASRILFEASQKPSSEAEKQAAILITLSRYNTGLPLAGIVNGYTNLVAAQMKPIQALSANSTLRADDQWDVWRLSAGHPHTWVIMAQRNSQDSWNGTQSADVRPLGHVVGAPSTTGEPYELSAYRESEAPRP